MSPEQLAEEMRQARLQSPLTSYEQALKQFAAVEKFLRQRRLRPKSKPSVSMAWPPVGSAASPS